MTKRGYIRKNKKLEAYLLMNEDRYRENKNKKVIDLEQLRGLAAIGATQLEMAAALGTSAGWIEKQIDNNPAVALAIEQGYTDMKHSLRRAQLGLALSGSPAMLIWLGKQFLGQSDKQEVETNTTINITVQRAMDELRNIPKDQLLAAQALLSAPTLDNQAIENSNESGAK